MTPAEPDTGKAPSGRDRLAQAWAGAVRRTSYVPMNWAELVEYFRGLTDEVVDILVSEPFQAQPGHPLGESLVNAHFTGPRTLGRTITTLHNRLLAELEPELDGKLTESERRDRVSALLGEIASGYAKALVDRTLDEQEKIRSAAITAQAKAERRMRASDARFRAVFAGAGTGIGIADLEGHVLDANQALASMLGYTVPELRRRTVAEFTHPSDRADLARSYADLVAGDVDRFRTQKRYSRKDGSDMWADMSVSLIREDDGDPHYVVIMMHDVTERHRLYERLRRQALQDPLTQLPNRVLFLDRLQERFDEYQEQSGDDDPGRIGLCYVDLDNFKAINDGLGHDVGDELLIRLANRLHERLVPVGHVVARTGGDEFLILVEDCQQLGDAIAVADDVLAVVREAVTINDHQLRITASVGVVVASLDQTSQADLMRAADLALHQAKSDGKNRWAVYDAEQHSSLAARHALAATLPAALSDDQLALSYQPIVDLDSRRPEGAKAVLTWHHPQFGSLHPDRFLDVAEETGLMGELNRWMLVRACHAAAAWAPLRAEDPPAVSVDLRTGYLREPGVVDDVRHALAESGLRPKLLQLELAGTAADTEQQRRNVEGLAALGVRLVLTGYGTGAANLSALRGLPVRGVTLAKTLVTGLRRADRERGIDSELVGNTLDLAHRLGLEVSADGIDTASILERLRAMGVRTGQGALFPAGTSADFKALLSAEPATSAT